MNEIPLPEPVLFHPLKHHLLYIRQFIRSASLYPEAGIKARLQTIGASQLDLYTGRLTPYCIGQEVVAFLNAYHILQAEAFREYLAETENSYRVINLSDGTDWILRWGVQDNRYVHLHPGRYAKNTLRIKATTLKTAIAFLIATFITKAEINIDLINRARVDLLGLSGVKDLNASEGLMRLIALLQDDA